MRFTIIATKISFKKKKTEQNKYTKSDWLYDGDGFVIVVLCFFVCVFFYEIGLCVSARYMVEEYTSVQVGCLM